MSEPQQAADSGQPSRPGGQRGRPSQPGGPRAGSRADVGELVVEPLPYDGVASVAVGTGLWLVALVVMLPFADDLDADGNLWWIATAAVGFVLGLAGLWIVVRRRNRLRAAATRAAA